MRVLFSRGITTHSVTCTNAHLQIRMVDLPIALNNYFAYEW